jgi:hypothetical protein
MPRRKTGRRVSCGNAGAVESVENQKQVSHFPTAPNVYGLKNKNRAAGGLRPRPAAGGGATRRLRVKK